MHIHTDNKEACLGWNTISIIQAPALSWDSPANLSVISQRRKQPYVHELMS